MWHALYLGLSNARTMPTNHVENGFLWTEFLGLGSEQINLPLSGAEER